MSKLRLAVTTQGIRGGKNKNDDKGYSLFTVYENGNTAIQISADTFEGLGAHYKERENTVIDIYFPTISGECRFSGTIAELKQKLFPNS